MQKQYVLGGARVSERGPRHCPADIHTELRAFYSAGALDAIPGRGQSRLIDCLAAPSGISTHLLYILHMTPVRRAGGGGSLTAGGQHGMPVRIMVWLCGIFVRWTGFFFLSFRAGVQQRGYTLRETRTGEGDQWICSSGLGGSSLNGQYYVSLPWRVCAHRGCNWR